MTISLACLADCELAELLSLPVVMLCRMAICVDCEREMTEAVSCTVTAFHRGLQRHDDGVLLSLDERIDHTVDLDVSWTTHRASSA